MFVCTIVLPIQVYIYILPPHIQARVTIAWLDALTTDLSCKAPDDEQLVLMAKAVILG